jgi:hypothetical protein
MGLALKENIIVQIICPVGCPLILKMLFGYMADYHVVINGAIATLTAGISCRFEALDGQASHWAEDWLW